MSNEVEELGQYVLRILEKTKKTEAKVQALEKSVNDINNLIADATEETEAPVETTPQRTQLTPLRLWAPLQIVKWIAICSAMFWIASLRTRMGLIEWNQVFPADWHFWISVEYILVGVSLAIAVGVEFFLYWRQREMLQPPREHKPEEAEAAEITEAEPETQEAETEAKAITEKPQENLIEPAQTPKTKKDK